ncbi:hypothetical protein EV177_002202 [Coemansia sp. RSA 1804]|nr:hypothetical protein EV177_002202 [Coemansia sp. RSA 1804]
MTEFRMAYLIKNNVETSCMVAVMSMKAVFVAANCIDMKSGYAVDQSVNYKLRYTPTDNDEEPTFDVAATHITIHPKYNQVTLENNIAIIEFNEDTDDDYVSFVSTNDFYAKIETYVRRNYDESKSEWDTPNVFNQYSEGDDCKNSSSLYETNSEWMSCTSSVTTSHVNSDCSIPYGIMYIDNTNATVMTSLYSHSVVYGNDIRNEV